MGVTASTGFFIRNLKQISDPITHVKYYMIKQFLTFFILAGHSISVSDAGFLRILYFFPDPDPYKK